MAANQRSDIHNTYVVGNNAVAYDYSKAQTPVQEPVRQHRKQTLKRASINPFYTMLMSTLVFLMLLICAIVLKAQFPVATTSEQVIELKKELTAKRRENAHLESIIHEQLDLVEIKRIAMEDYGMVFPGASDVIEIEPEATSYTVQHKIIEPVQEEGASIGNILAFITRGW